METNPMWVHAIGITASALAFLIALYLQIYVRRVVKAKYVLTFVILGMAIFLLSVRSQHISDNTLTYVRASGYLLFIALEIWGLRVALKDTGYTEQH